MNASPPNGEIGYRLLFTHPRGAVTLVGPSLRSYRCCTAGGATPWEPHIRRRSWMEADVHRRFMMDGVPEAAGWRRAKARAWGGLVTSEYNEAVLAIERCTPVKLAPELLDLAEVSSDRWFRNAWRRREDGGPIYIDLEIARQIQADTIAWTLDDWNRRAIPEDLAARLRGRRTNGPAIIEIDADRFARLIRDATNCNALKAIWPEELPRPRHPHIPAKERPRWRN